MKKTTISRKFLKLNITILLLSLVSLCAIVFYIISDNAKSQFINTGSDILSYSSSQLEQVFSNAEQTLHAIEESYVNGHRKTQETKDLLSSLQQSTSVYQHTFMVFKSGHYILTPNNENIPDEFDPRTREWYQDAIANFNEYKWSNPYYDIDTNELVITCSKAFRDPITNETIVIGLDMTIDSLREMMTALSANNYGYMMLVNQQDIIILHSDPMLINEQLQSYEDHLLIAEFHSETPIYRTSTGIFMQETLPTQRMYLIHYFSNDEMVKRIIPFIITFMLFIGLFLLVAFIASFNISKRITTPILKLKDSMDKASNNELLKPCEVTTNDEIDELIDGYNFLVNDINEKTLEMTALYEQLSSSEETLQEQYDELYKNREQIIESENKYRLLTEASTQGLMEIQKDNTLTFHSKKWFNQFDLPKGHVEIKDWMSLIHPDDLSRVKESLMNHFNKKTAVFQEEYRMTIHHTDTLWLSSIGQAVFDINGSFMHMIISHNDITHKKNSESKILNMAYTDELTGLLNRTRLKEVISESIKNSEQGTMFYVDLDNFKALNDTYGHSYGDQVLIQISRRLKNCNSMNCEIARISGDEFAIVVKSTLSLSRIEEIANQLIETISQQIIINDIEFFITASVGAASYPYDAKNFEDLLVNSDISMHRAKGNPKSKFVIFTESIKNEILSTMAMERQLQQSLDRNELSVHYQPIVRMTENKIVGFEALVRWNNKELGSIPPDKFIPVAEHNKFIIPLGDYVMREALQFIIKLNKEFNTQYEVALNISAIQLQQDDYCKRVINLLEVFDYHPEHLNLEITESIALDSDPKIIENLKNLSNIGIPISLDDFGTGYSTFNNLIELPLDHLKIDKGIVQRSITDDHVYKLINSIVEFAHQMNISVIAEGIEDVIMVERMKDISIDFAQGYLYSKPIDGAKLRQLIKNKSLVN